MNISSRKTVTIEQVSSSIGRPHEQRETLKGLRLNKIGRQSSLEDTPSVRGMIAKVVVDHVLQLARRSGRAGRRQALPEETVVPDLRRIVEQALVALVLGGLDHFDQRSALKPLFAEHAVGLINIGLVVLAVVIVEGFGRHVRDKRVFGIRKLGKDEGHGIAPAGVCR